jgi:hypothetical protein
MAKNAGGERRAERKRRRNNKIPLMVIRERLI